MKFRILSYFLILFLISSCGILKSNIKSDWSCTRPDGGSCKTIDEIDNNYTKHSTKKNKNNKPTSAQKLDLNKNYTSFDELRSKEKVSRVMFSPYVDKAGNRHDKSVVYYLELNSDWIDN